MTIGNPYCIAARGIYLFTVLFRPNPKTFVGSNIGSISA